MTAEPCSAEPRSSVQIATALNVNPRYQSALRDAESESWDEPGVEGTAMIEAASARRQALRGRADDGVQITTTPATG